MSKKEIFKYLIESNSSMALEQIILSMCMALVLGLFMYFIYKKTFTGIVYSKNFNSTLVLVAIITTMVMTIIGGNLALSLGMVGSLSIIRFRTAIKEPRDIAFMFWAIAIGLACGSEMYVVAIVGSIVIAIVLFCFKFDIYDNKAYLVVIKGKKLDNKAVNEALNKGTKRWKVRMQNTSDVYEEATYEVTLGKKDNYSDLISNIKAISNVEAVNIVAYTGEIVG